MSMLILDETNKDFAFINIPNDNVDNDKAFMRIKSLRGKTEWYVLEKKGNTLRCIIKNGIEEPIIRDVYIWELWQNDCYVDDNFKVLDTDEIIKSITVL